MNKQPTIKEYRIIYIIVSIDENGGMYNTWRILHERVQRGKKYLESKAQDTTVYYDIETIVLHYV